MAFAPPPPTARWRHLHVRAGSEVASFRPRRDGWHIEGCTTASDADDQWEVDYVIDLDPGWATLYTEVQSRCSSRENSRGGERSITLHTTGDGLWLLDGQRAPALDGCLDVDLESSAVTNALPVHRLGLALGARAEAPAAYVRAPGLAVERLDQTYTRLPDQESRQCFGYEAPAFDVACDLLYDESGLVVDYPGIAVRTR